MGLFLYTALALFAYVLYKWLAGRLPKIPGPWGLPIVGSIPFLGRKMNVTMTEYSKIYGDIFQVAVGSRRMVVVNGYKANKLGMTGSKGLDFAARPNFKSYEGFGVFGEHGYQPHHRACKRLTLQAMNLFGDERKVELQEIGSKAVQMFFDSVKEGEPFDPKPLLYNSVWAIMCFISYGEYFEKNDPDVKAIFDTVEVFGKSVMFGVVYDYLPWTKWFFNKQITQMNDLMHKITTLSKRLAARNFSTWDGHSTRTMADMLSLAKKDVEDHGLDDEKLMEMLTSLFGAGFGTVASICRWSTLLLAKYPEHQEPLYEEIVRVVGKTEAPTFDDAKRLPVTTATLAEVYRFSSMSALGITHASVKDTELMGYPIPFDTPVIFNLYSAHYDERVFDQPYEFNPRRFLTDDDELKTDLLDLIMPYGLGWRRCGGEPLAKMEIFLFFTSIFQKARVVVPKGMTVDPTDYIMTLGLDPRPFKIQLEMRQ